MEQFKKNAAVIVLGVIAAAMLIGNICFVVFAKSSVKKATITKQEVKTVAGKDVRYEEDSDNFTVSKSSNISEKMESPAAATPEPEATADAPDASQNNGDYIFPAPFQNKDVSAFPYIPPLPALKRLLSWFPAALQWHTRRSVLQS